MKEDAVLVCCLCGCKIANGRGNNARPVGPARCCHDCNRSIVEPHRMKPPKVSPAEELERIAGVEKILLRFVDMYSDTAWLLSSSGEEDESSRAFASEIRAKYPEMVAAVSEDREEWLPLARGMLAAFRLAHGLVAGGEDEDLAKESFPDFDP